MTTPSRSMTNGVSSGSPTIRSAITRSRSKSPHQRATSGSPRMLARTGASAGVVGRRMTSRPRSAYAIATGVVRPRDVLIVTFTDKAATEMVRRLAALGEPGVTASTFHAAALRQLRHFWPRVHGVDPPAILDSKAPILARLAAG